VLVDDGRAGTDGRVGLDAIASRRAGGGSMPEYTVTGKRSGIVCVCGYQSQ